MKVEENQNIIAALNQKIEKLEKEIKKWLI